MSKKPQKPQKGQPAIKQLYNSVCDIIDYLPSLEVRGDQKSTYVTKSSAGTVIHAAQTASTTKQKANDYYAGSGLTLVSGNVFNVDIDPNTMAIVNNKLSCTVKPSGGGGGDPVYYNDGRFIEISGDNNSINCTLSALTELYNPSFASDTRPLESQLSTVTYDGNHFMQVRDWIGNKGVNTILSTGFYNTHTQAGETQEEAEYIYGFRGMVVNCVLTGGRFIEVNSHWQDSGGETPEEIEPDDHSINNLLSGDNVHIFICELAPNANGSWGGVISTNIHADETTITMAADGTLSLKGSAPTPTPGGGDLNYPIWQNLAGSGNVVWPQMRYTATDGGWLRISYRSTNQYQCHGVWIEDNYIGLGTGPDTWPLAIPPGSSFYIEFPSGSDFMAWFDTNTTPAKTTSSAVDYWRTAWGEDANTVRGYVTSAQSQMNIANSQRGYAESDYDTLSSDWMDWVLDQQKPAGQQQGITLASYDWYLSYKDSVAEYASTSRTAATNSQAAATAVHNFNSSPGIQPPNQMFEYRADEYATKANQYALSAEFYQTCAAYIYSLRLQQPDT